MKKAIFLDRDGIINEPIMRGLKVISPRRLEEWKWVDGIHEAVHRFKTANLLVLVVTNQPDISRKLLSIERLQKFNQMIKEELQVDDIVACTHDDADQCSCRKPKPGMLLSLAEKWDISLQHSILIGDTSRDMEAAKKTGCFRILIDRDYNKGTDCDYLARDLNEATQYILD